MTKRKEGNRTREQKNWCFLMDKMLGLAGSSVLRGDIGYFVRGRQHEGEGYWWEPGRHLRHTPENIVKQLKHDSCMNNRFIEVIECDFENRKMKVIFKGRIQP